MQPEPQATLALPRDLIALIPGQGDLMAKQRVGEQPPQPPTLGGVAVETAQGRRDIDLQREWKAPPFSRG